MTEINQPHPAVYQPMPAPSCYVYEARLLGIVRPDLLVVSIDLGFDTHVTRRLQVAGVVCDAVTSDGMQFARAFWGHQLRRARMRIQTFRCRSEVVLADVWRPASASDYGFDLVSAGVARSWIPSPRGPVAQRTEQACPTRMVEGSSPSGATTPLDMASILSTVIHELDEMSDLLGGGAVASRLRREAASLRNLREALA